MSPGGKDSFLEKGHFTAWQYGSILPLLLCFLADTGKTEARIIRFLKQAPSDGCKDQQTKGVFVLDSVPY